MPHAAPQLVVLRQQREQERLQLLRKLIKRLERIEAPRLVQALAERTTTWPGKLEIPSMLTAGAMALSTGVLAFRRRRAS